MQTRISQKALIQNSEGKILVLFRTETAPSCPSTWDFPGGELEVGEEPAPSILREIQEEAGLQVDKLQAFDVEAHIVNGEEFWVTIAYEARAKTEGVKLSFEHNDFRWVTPEEFLQLPSQEKLYRFVRNLQ